ncbi:MAG: TetR/AcrR family transcriptional regulator [Spiribacter salinus]|uniref:TetR/AcrR family transcriptional regulator n=1 Tax=Spiribacter salinus TaxID=1335746 RepID=A0A540VSF7_9GAMM|nr:MAG: TetR/AcrR family transcriptional regulator [Spiribacter salinus]
MIRDREHSERRLIRAVGEIVAKQGFHGLGVNAVARAAGVDKVLIYRYFDGLPNLLRAYGESGDFWPGITEVLGDDSGAVRALPVEARLERVIVGLLDALRARPQTIEILAWETVEDNALTQALADIRERWGLRVIEEVLPDANEHPEDVLALASVLVAGVQYLMIRARRSTAYGGLELRTEEGWERIRRAIALACRIDIER